MIVLTGGAGFIGSGILSRLNLLGRSDIVVVDHIEDGEEKERNLEGKRYAAYMDKALFIERVMADDLPWPVEGIIHMGACSSTVLQDARYFEENNVAYSCRLASWALRKGLRFVYASSAATYGDGSQGYSDEERLLPRLAPLNLYGDSKHRFDLWMSENGHLRRAAGLKFFNVFGPNEYHKGEMRSVVAKAYRKAAETGRMVLFKSHRIEFADGEQKRDFIYVKDVIDVVLYFWENRRVNGIFNVGTGRARSWNDLARALFAALGRPVRIDYIEMPPILRDRYQYFTEARIEKLRDSGYDRPFTSLEEAVKDYTGYLAEGRYL